MRGQILNLTQALKDAKSPLQLVQMPVVIGKAILDGNHKSCSRIDIFPTLVVAPKLGSSGSA